MSQRIVYEILKESKEATIDEILTAIKSKGIPSANNRVKVRDSLILLSRQGAVKEVMGNGVLWQVSNHILESERCNASQTKVCTS